MSQLCWHGGSAAESSVDVAYSSEEPNIRFDCLHPDFVEKYGGKFRWANVVRLRNGSDETDAATTYPTNYRNPKIPRLNFGDGHTLSTTVSFR